MRNLLANAAKTTDGAGQAHRPDRAAGPADTTPCSIAAERTEHMRWTRSRRNISAVSQQLKGFIADNRQTLKPALDKLNGVLTIVDDRKDACRTRSSGSTATPCRWASPVAPGPFFKAYMANLLPGQFVQPFVDAAFSDLGLDPDDAAAVAADRSAGRASRGLRHCRCPTRAPARAASRTEPARRDHRQPRRPACAPGLPLPGPGCYPYREPLPAPRRRPAARPAAAQPDRPVPSRRRPRCSCPRPTGNRPTPRPEATMTKLRNSAPASPSSWR